jgi:hypothetical protein
MDFKTQQAGLNRFLSAVFGEDTHLNGLLVSLGFEQEQIALLHDQYLEPVISQFVDVIHKRLTSESGKDNYFQLLNHRYGLDGEPPEPLEAVAGRLNFSPEYARRVSEEALKNCQSKTAKEDFRKGLRYIIISELGKVAGRPPRERVADKLERLTNLRTAADLVHMDYEAKRAGILKQIQSELDALDSEYNPLFEAATGNIAGIEAEIKNDVLLYGESIQAGTYRAVYVQGRVSWDNDGMNHYAASHPDILQFRKQGQPSVTLRVVEEKMK